MTFDWEAEMKEVRSKATAAARHGERTLGGVAEALMALQSQDKHLSDMSKTVKATEARLGSLEATLRATQARQVKNPAEATLRLSVPLWSGAAGLFVGVVLSGVFFWN